MTSNLVKFCAAAIAGSLIGVVYDGWPKIRSNTFDEVSADSSIGPPRNTPKLPFDGSESHSKFPETDAKRSADFLVQSSKFGLPSTDNLRVFNDFVLSYDRRLRSPVWVMEHLHPGKLDLDNNVSRRHSRFVEDITLHHYFRATSRDFKNSKLDRGHMAAAANHKLAQDDMDQTFVLSNISPQEKIFNSGAWNSLETYVRWLAKRSRNLYVVTGPLYLPYKADDGEMYVTYRVIGDNMVSVPTHYFKVILIESQTGSISMEAFMMPNDPRLTAKTKLDNYRVQISDLDTIERASGVIFFNVVKRDQIEAPTSIPSNFKVPIYDTGKTRLPEPS